MKNIELIIPKLEEYSYEQKLESEPKTMNYNAGYNIMIQGALTSLKKNGKKFKIEESKKIDISHISKTKT